MTPAAILRAAAKRLGSDATWTQRAMARLATGLPIDPFHERAMCWDMTGAVIVTGGDEDRIACALAMDAVGDVLGMCPMRWNDEPGRTAAEVRAKLIEVADRLEPVEMAA